MKGSILIIVLLTGCEPVKGSEANPYDCRDHVPDTSYVRSKQCMESADLVVEDHVALCKCRPEK